MEKKKEKEKRGIQSTYLGRRCVSRTNVKTALLAGWLALRLDLYRSPRWRPLLCPPHCASGVEEKVCPGVDRGRVKVVPAGCRGVQLKI